MNRDGYETAEFFIGTEVEHSPAFGMKTLFVIGVHDSTRIVGLAQKNNCDHIYFGANQSFTNPGINDADEWRRWETMIGGCLMHGAWCTLDLDLQSAEGLLEGSLIDHSRFIPMISVKLPYAKLYNYNTTIKIDDRDFQATNPGVWCHSLHDLKNRAVFTDWSKYTQDEVIS
jgi:hypothetical protein